MGIQILNCASMSPWWPRWHIGGVCLLVDTDAIPLPFSPRMYLIQLFGHTSGHCGVAIEDGSGWLMHCSDALPTNAQFDLTPDWLNRMVIGPYVPRLKAFAAAHPEVRLLAGHAWRADFK